MTPIAFPSARAHLQGPDGSPLTRSSKGATPFFTPVQMRRPTPFHGSQLAASAARPLPPGPRVTHAARPVRPARRRRGPLVLDGATRELDEALDRDTVLDVFFDFTRQYVDYAALFVIIGDLAEGRDSFGEGVARDRVAGIGVPLELPSMLQTARNRRAVVQVVPSGGIDEELMTDLGRGPGSPVVLVPVVVRGRVVALYLGDSGPGGVEVDSLETISSFALLAGQAFERAHRPPQERAPERPAPAAHRRRHSGRAARPHPDDSPRRSLGRGAAAAVAARAAVVQQHPRRHLHRLEPDRVARA